MKRTRKYGIYTLLLLLMATLLLSAFVSTVLARYATAKDQTQTVVTPSFYFESNMLSAEGETHSFNASVDSVTFYLYNFTDSLRQSTLDIAYTVTVTCEGSTVYTASGSLAGNTETRQPVTVTGLASGKVYEVEATGTNGFSKTLRAEFKIYDETGCYQQVDSSNPYYVILKVWTANSGGNVQVIPPPELIPDNTCEGMENALTGGTLELSVTPYTSRVFRFFKPSGYTGGYDFTVTLDGVDATVVTG